MKLREVVPENGPHLGRVREFSDEQGQAILDLDERRGIKTWELADDSDEVTEGEQVKATAETTAPAPPAETTGHKSKQNPANAAKEA
jgi:hypothetical protein